MNEKITPFVKEWETEFNKKNQSHKVKVHYKNEYILQLKWAGFKPTQTKEETVEVDYDDYKAQVIGFEDTDKHNEDAEDPQKLLSLFVPNSPKKTSKR